MTYPGNQPTLPNLPPSPGKRSLAWLSRWWDAGPGHKAAIFAAIPLLFVCACCSASLIFAATPYGQQLARETEATQTVQAANAAQATATAHEYALLHPAPTKAPTATRPPTSTPQSTATITPQPTATARATATPHPAPPTATPKPAPPTATSVPPTATPCADPCNPWGYNFVPGNLIYSPPGDFCAYFACINNFWNGRGYVVECNDTMYSLSGGIQGACSYHNGVWRPLYSH